MNEEELRNELRVLSCNWQVTHTLLQEVIALLPQREQVLQRFQGAIDALSKNAPKHVDPEYVVELRARAAQTVLQMRDGPPFANTHQAG